MKNLKGDPRFLASKDWIEVDEGISPEFA